MLKISLIVAAYNVENEIKRCLSSLVHQTYQEIEIIVINDGSTDETSQRIQECQVDKMQVIHTKNQGLIEARKTGLSYATGDYVMFVDGDDWLRYDCCQRVSEKIEKEQADLVYFNLVYAYDYHTKAYPYTRFPLLTGESYLKKVLRNELRANIVLQCIRRDFLQSDQITLPQGITYGEDLALTVAIALLNPKVSCIAEGLYYYYQRPKSVTNQLNHRVFDLNQVFQFIYDELQRRNLAEKYEQEYQYLAFIHFYYYRIICSTSIEPLHADLYKQWHKRGERLKENPYYVAFLNEASMPTRVKLALFNIHFLLGKLVVNIFQRARIN